MTIPSHIEEFNRKYVPLFLDMLRPLHEGMMIYDWGLSYDAILHSLHMMQLGREEHAPRELLGRAFCEAVKKMHTTEEQLTERLEEIVFDLKEGIAIMASSSPKKIGVGFARNPEREDVYLSLRFAPHYTS